MSKTPVFTLSALTAEPVAGTPPSCRHAHGGCTPYIYTVVLRRHNNPHATHVVGEVNVCLLHFEEGFADVADLLCRQEPSFNRTGGPPDYQEQPNREDSDTKAIADTNRAFDELFQGLRALAAANYKLVQSWRHLAHPNFAAQEALAVLIIDAVSHLQRQELSDPISPAEIGALPALLKQLGMRQSYQAKLFGELLAADAWLDGVK